MSPLSSARRTAIAAGAALAAAVLVVTPASAQTAETACQVRSASFEIAPIAIDPTAATDQFTYATLVIAFDPGQPCEIRATLPVPLAGQGEGAISIAPSLDMGAATSSVPGENAWLRTDASGRVRVQWRLAVAARSPAQAPGRVEVSMQTSWYVRTGPDALASARPPHIAVSGVVVSIAPGFQFRALPSCGNSAKTLRFAAMKAGQTTCATFAIVSNTPLQLAFQSLNNGRLVHESDQRYTATYAAELVWPAVGGAITTPLFSGRGAGGAIPVAAANGEGAITLRLVGVEGALLAGDYTDTLTIEISVP